MRVDAKQPPAKSIGRLSPRSVWSLALAAIGMMWLLLVAARLVASVPKPLLVTLGASFSVWAVCVGLWRGRSVWPRWRTLLTLGAPWLVGITAALGALYGVDRGGWLWFLVTGYDVTPVDVLPDRIDSTPADFARHYPAFVLDPADPTRLLLPRGQYTFRETVVVPRGTLLTIAPGAVLRFGPGRSLISYSPIRARGTATEPIQFAAQHRWLKWGVVGITGTAGTDSGRADSAADGSTSLFEYVHVADNRQARVNGIDFVAGLSVFDADVEIVHSQFVNAFGKDAVNVRRSHVLIRDNLFRQTYKDGLDLDGGAGEVHDNRFIDCADEGIDLSENEQLTVFDNTILDRRGGRISADVDLDTIRAANTLDYSTTK